jgi:hypothetical protein
MASKEYCQCDGSDVSKLYSNQKLVKGKNNGIDEKRYRKFYLREDGYSQA